MPTFRAIVCINIDSISLAIQDAIPVPRNDMRLESVLIPECFPRPDMRFQFAITAENKRQCTAKMRDIMRAAGVGQYELTVVAEEELYKDGRKPRDKQRHG